MFSEYVFTHNCDLLRRKKRITVPPSSKMKGSPTPLDQVGNQRFIFNLRFLLLPLPLKLHFLSQTQRFSGEGHPVFSGNKMLTDLRAVGAPLEPLVLVVVVVVVNVAADVADVTAATVNRCVGATMRASGLGGEGSRSDSFTSSDSPVTSLSIITIVMIRVANNFRFSQPTKHYRSYWMLFNLAELFRHKQRKLLYIFNLFTPNCTRYA